MNGVLYSERLSEKVSVSIVDGECTKNRFGDKNLTPEEIESFKKEYQNILIQTKEKIEIYCSKEKAGDLGYLFKNEPALMKLFLNGTIKVFANKGEV